MNKGRTKKLRKLFRETFGRDPNKTMWNIHSEVVEQDEFRKFKKQHG